MDELLDAAGVARRSVPVAGAVRMNISVLEPDGTTTKLNEPGPRLSPAEVDALLDRHPRRRSDGADWVVGCGSLPPGAPTALYAALVTRVRERGIRVAVDSSGAPMPRAVAARPHLIKPNHEELAELVGHPLPTLGDVRAAARDLVADGIEVVAVSLGGDGALLVTADELRARPRDHHRPPVHRGRRRLHARRPAPRPVDAASPPPTPSPPPSRGAPPPSPSPAAACRPRTTSTASPSRSPVPPTHRSSCADPERKHHAPHHRRAGRPRPDRCRPPRGHPGPRAQRLVASGRCTDLDTFLADVAERESKMATGLPGGIGIPHARSAAITEPSLVFGRSTDGIDWGAKDGPATLVFLIAAPEGGGDAHMQMLPKLARALMKKDFKAALAAATTEAEVVRIVEAEVALDPARPRRSRRDRRRGRRGHADRRRTRRRCARRVRHRPRLPRPPRSTTAPRPLTSSASPRARPASPTPTWRPRPSRTPRRPPVTS